MTDFSLETADYDRLLTILVQIDQLEVYDGQRPFVNLVVQDIAPDYRDALINQIRWVNNRHSFALSLLNAFLSFKTDKADRLAMVPFLLAVMVHHQVPSEDRAFIEGLFAKYPALEQGRSLSVERAEIDWRGGETAQQVHKEAIEKETWFDVLTLRRALIASQSVVLLRMGDTITGTGFWVSPRLVMTCYHVASHDHWRDIKVILNYEKETEENTRPTQQRTLSANTEGWYFGNRELDYAVFEVFGDGTGIPLKLSAPLQKVEEGDRLIIIHHPEGDYKKISMTNNFVRHADHTRIQYTTLTEKGSSGAPLFNSRFEVVGLHRLADYVTDPADGKVYFRREGSHIQAIVNDLQNQKIWKQIQEG